MGRMDIDIELLKQQYAAVAIQLNERERRFWAAKAACTLGYGGISAVSRAIGISRKAIYAGIKESKQDVKSTVQRTRRPGGGRKSVLNLYPSFPEELEKLIEPVSLEDFDSPIRWTCKSISKLAQELSNIGIKVSRQTVANQLHVLGYGLCAHVMIIAENPHPRRELQFEYIFAKCKEALKHNIPVIAINTKRKVLSVGHAQGRSDIANSQKSGSSRHSLYDFTINSPYFDLYDCDIFPIVVPALSKWMKAEGKRMFLGARQIFVAIDWGAADGSSTGFLKRELQYFADEFHLKVCVSHFPAGTYKWNKYQHCLFSFLSQHCRDHPMLNYETAIYLISPKKLECSEKRQLEEKRMSKRSIRSINKKEVTIFPDDFYGDWNYEIRPKD